MIFYTIYNLKGISNSPGVKIWKLSTSSLNSVKKQKLAYILVASPKLSEYIYLKEIYS